MRSEQYERFSALEIVLIVLCFCICLTGALLLPVDKCPDEGGRCQISDWIYRTGTLPTGDEWQTILMKWQDTSAPVGTIIPDTPVDGWGFSYALRPYLSSIIAALFMKAASLFTGSPRALFVASRMGSVLSVTLCCFFCLRLGHRLFERRGSALLFATLVCFLPQVMFLGMYQNNDIMALCTVSMMLYFWVEGCKRKWPVQSCVGLAVSFSMGLLSYYSIYGWILMCALFCVPAVLTDPEIPDKGRLILRRAALIAGICLLLAGWFFIRNAILHNGDFLGIASEETSREKMRALGYTLYDYVRYCDLGMDVAAFLQMGDRWWLRMTCWSFVGVFGYMDILLPMPQYNIYYLVFITGAVLYAAVLIRHKPGKRDALLMFMMVSAGVITFFLHFWQSYARDYQPQGRYVITLILPLAYMPSYGSDKTVFAVRDPKTGKAVELNPAVVLSVLWLTLFVWAACGTMTKML